MSLWVFGYGSLLWNPGFEPAEAARARIEGYHRSFCMLSVHHRGTEENPGLVLALDERPGAFCEGMALRVREGQEEQVLAELRARELVSSAYVEMCLPVALARGDSVQAVAYVVDRAHRQYCDLPLEEQAHRILLATGGRGPNTEYLFNTAAHIAELGIIDAELSWLAARVGALIDGKTGPDPIF